MKYLRRSALLLIILVSCVTFCFAQNPPPPPAPAIEYNESAWKEVASEVGHFTILMPGTPVLTVEMLETDAGKIPYHRYLLSTGTAQYLVSFATSPVRLDEPSALTKVMDDSRDNILVENRSAKLLNETEVALEGRGGREWLIESGNSLTRIRAFFINGRFYQIGITTPLNLAFNTGRPSSNRQDRTDFYETISTKFLDSFKLSADEKVLGEVDNYLAKEQVMDKATENSRGALVKGGVIQGKAISLPQPAYPPIARAARAEGRVTVRVIVDEEGKVVAAQAESGHPLLQQAAVSAARQARFPPTMLEGKPVRVLGLLSYNFVAK